MPNKYKLLAIKPLKRPKKTRIFESRISYDKNHKFLVTALTKENCIESTRWYLKFLQDTK